MTMKFTEIKRALEDKGYNQADVARLCKVSAPTVHLVIKGQTTSTKIRIAISDIIRTPIKEIWANSEGTKLRTGPKLK
ncbi:MAG: helix-turn-helix domain-containing protein [Desulfotalea sp.]